MFTVQATMASCTASKQRPENWFGNSCGPAPLGVAAEQAGLGRLSLGNSRLISAWPMRGGPVLRDDKLYFAASIWPFMGTFIYALDAKSGRVLWCNDETGAQ